MAKRKETRKLFWALLDLTGEGKRAELEMTFDKETETMILFRAPELNHPVYSKYEYVTRIRKDRIDRIYERNPLVFTMFGEKSAKDTMRMLALQSISLLKSRAAVIDGAKTRWHGLVGENKD